MKYLIGNWKSNYTLKEAEEWIQKVGPKVGPVSKNLTVVLCPSFIHLSLFAQKFPDQILGSQYISPFPNGAYTGEISSTMLKGLVSYTIVGHSERRQYFSESNNTVANQITQALEVGITPIIAVDHDNWHTLLSLVSKSDLEKCLVMYEPPGAISTQKDGKSQGQAACVDDVVEHIQKIKADFTPKAVIYGGSVKSGNILDFLARLEIEGVLPGSGSLDVDEWVKMITLASQFAG